MRRSTELPGERLGHELLPPELREQRRAMAAALDAGIWRTEGPAQPDILGAVRVIRVQPPSAKRGTVLHLHGGGFRIGCPEMVGAFAAALATRCGVEVVCPAYRLAPEHPFPAALADARAVLRVLRSASQDPLIVSGDSAGGGLAAGLTRLCVTDAQLPQGLVLLSPWLDLTITSQTYQTNAATDPLFSTAAARQAADLYLQGLSAEHPLASPLFSPVTGFPPTFISFGQEEVLADDGRRFYSALRAAGVRARLLSISGMQHVAITRNLGLPGAAETFEAVVEFIDSLFKKEP